MHHFATALSAVIIATVLVGGTSPTPAEAATTSSADKAALKEATAACKAEAKENKIRWPASRKYVSNCVAKPQWTRRGVSWSAISASPIRATKPALSIFGAIRMLTQLEPIHCGAR
jgi:hypothetical protein